MSGKRGKRGRPSKYTKAIAAEICLRLSEGETLRAICRDDKMPTHSAVLRWARDDVEGFFNQYTRARAVGLDVMADEMVEISDSANLEIAVDEKGKPTIKGSDPQRDRLRVDTRKWYLSKLAPKRYGESKTVDVNVNNRVDPADFPDDELADIARSGSDRITEAAASTPKPGSVH